MALRQFGIAELLARTQTCRHNNGKRTKRVSSSSRKEKKTAGKDERKWAWRHEDLGRVAKKRCHSAKASKKVDVSTLGTMTSSLWSDCDWWTCCP